MNPSVHKIVRKFIGTVSIAATLFVVGCSSSPKQQVSDLFVAHEKFANAQMDWIAADIALIEHGCNVLRTTDRAPILGELHRWEKIVAENPADDNITHQSEARGRIQALDDRLQTCKSVQSLSARLSSYRENIPNITDSNRYDSLHEELGAFRGQTRAVITAFPSEMLRLSNYTDTMIGPYKAAHTTALSAAGEAVATVVDSARDASGKAVKSTIISVHEADKDLAKASDAAYTEARTSLGAIQTASDPDAVFSAIDATFKAAEHAIALADSATTNTSANPVADVREAVPKAAYVAFTATSAPKPVPTRYVAAFPADTASTMSSESSTPAVNLVRRYYRLWNSRDYRTMYGMLSARMQKKYPYVNYVKYHDFVQRIDVDASPSAEDSVVNLRITSQDIEKDGSTSTSVNGGQWFVIMEGDSMLLDDEIVHEVK